MSLDYGNISYLMIIPSICNMILEKHNVELERGKYLDIESGYIFKTKHRDTFLSGYPANC